MSDVSPIYLKCKSCPIRQNCPKFEDGAHCWYELNESPDLETSRGIFEMMQSKVRDEHFRYQRAIRKATSKGGEVIDPDTTTLSNSLTRDIQALVTLGLKFGFLRSENGLSETDDRKVLQQFNITNIGKEAIAECQQLTQQLTQLRESAQTAQPIRLRVRK